MANTKLTFVETIDKTGSHRTLIPTQVEPVKSPPAKRQKMFMLREHKTYYPDPEKPTQAMPYDPNYKPSELIAQARAGMRPINERDTFNEPAHWNANSRAPPR